MLRDRGQRPALTHQLQPAGADLVLRQHRQRVQQSQLSPSTVSGILFTSAPSAAVPPDAGDTPPTVSNRSMVLVAEAMATSPG